MRSKCSVQLLLIVVVPPLPSDTPLSFALVKKQQRNETKKRWSCAFLWTFDGFLKSGKKPCWTTGVLKMKAEENAVFWMLLLFLYRWRLGVRPTYTAFAEDYDCTLLAYWCYFHPHSCCMWIEKHSRIQTCVHCGHNVSLTHYRVW